MTPAEIAALTDEQIAQLTAEQIDSLSNELLESILEGDFMERRVPEGSRRLNESRAVRARNSSSRSPDRLSMS